VSLVVRQAALSDVPDLLETDRLVLMDGRGQVRGAEELPDEARLQARIAQRGTWVAEVDGRVVGEGEVHALGPWGCRHVGVLSLQVHPAWQGRGVGRALLGALIERASALGIYRLELYVRSDNDRAIRLYRSLGFAHECTRRAFVRRRDGSLIDDYVMVRWLARDPRPRTVVLSVWQGHLLVLQHPQLGWQLPAPVPGARLVRDLGRWTEVDPDGVWLCQGQVHEVELEVDLPGCVALPLGPGLIEAFPPRLQEVLLRALTP
jgi:ribosomal protein S18 acetylase RimI-like enzyme